MQNLVQLDLSINKIGFISSKSIDLPKLEWIDLEMNNLKTVHAEKGELGLSEFKSRKFDLVILDDQDLAEVRIIPLTAGQDHGAQIVVITSCYRPAKVKRRFADIADAVAIGIQLRRIGVDRAVVRLVWHAVVIVVVFTGIVILSSVGNHRAIIGSVTVAVAVVSVHIGTCQLCPVSRKTRRKNYIGINPRLLDSFQIRFR